MRYTLGGVVALIVAAATPTVVAAQDCGYCDEETHPELGEIHRMAADAEGGWKCYAAPGHPAGCHTDWTDPGCDSHGRCGIEEPVPELAARLDIMSAAAVREFVARNKAWVSHDRVAGTIAITSCIGTLLALLTISQAARAEPGT
jgi:hypothetical protein